MILELLGYLVAALTVSLLGYLLIVAANNREKYRFFEKNAPGLKVLENPSLFGGHINQIVHVKHNVPNGMKIFEKHGPTVGFYYGTKPAVVTTDLDFIKIFTIDEQNHINRTKAHLPIKEVEEDCIMFAEDEQWVRIRKAIAPAFSAHKIKLSNVQSDINSVIEKLVGYLERQLDASKSEDKSVELDGEYLGHRFTLALVFLLFYKQDNVIDWHSEHDQFADVIEKNLHEITGFWTKLCAAFPILQTPLNWLTLNFHSTGRMRNTIMNYIKQQTKLHFEAAKQLAGKDFNESTEDFTLKDGTKFRRNMIDYVIDQYREGKISRSEYFNSTFFVFFAGDKTVADALGRLFHNLANHQDVQAKLRQSIVESESGTDSEYLTWCIHETLRLHPSVPIGASRVIKRDIQTKHGLVPAGTFVVTPPYAIHRLKEYWGDDIETFRPERWANSKNFHPVQFLGFGGGRRICLGRELAMMEMRMLMNVLMRSYKFDMPTIHTEDNSKLFTSPVLAFLHFDFPTYVRISRLDSASRSEPPSAPIASEL